MSRCVPCGLVAQPAVITAGTAVPATIINLRLVTMDSAHAPIGSDGPALNAVQVIDGCDRAVGAAHVGQLLDGGLHVAGLPSQYHGRRKRVWQIGSTGPCICASLQVWPPLADTSTRVILPRPLHARPVTS